MSNKLNHWTETLCRVSCEALRAQGDYYATARLTARFCTEALVDACEYLPQADYQKHDRRANAIYRLATWANAERLRLWKGQFEREQAARIQSILNNLQGCV